MILFARINDILISAREMLVRIAIGRIGRIVVSLCPETDYTQGSVTGG